MDTFFFISLKKKDNNLLIALLFFFSAKPACSLKVSNPSHAVKTVYNLPFVLFADKFFWVHYLHPQAFSISFSKTSLGVL